MPQRFFHKIRSSISVRIVLIIIIPLGLIMSFFSYKNYQRERDSIFISSEAQLLRIGDGVKESIEILMKNNDLPGLQNMLMDMSRGSDITRITFFDEGKRAVASTNKEWIGKKLIDFQQTEMTESDVKAVQRGFIETQSAYYDSKEHHYCLAMPVHYSGQKLGVVHICLDLKDEQKEIIKRSIENFFIALLATVMMGVSVFLIFHFLFVVKIKSVSSAAHKLASGDMTARASEKGSDELSDLAVSFNSMAEGIAVWHSNLEKIAASRMKELLVLFEVVNTISQSLEMETVLPKVLELVTDNMGVAKGAIVLVGGDGRTIALFVQRGLSDEGIRQITQFGTGGIGDVILRNKTMRIEAGAAGESNFIPGFEQDNIASALLAPISARGTMLGVVAAYSEKKDQFTDEDESLIATIGNQLSVAVLNARLYEETLSLARLDGLTGLANRRYLMERLKQEVDRAERYQTSLSVIMLDLDKFKTFNDTYGHLKGDELLKAFSALVKRMVRATDIAGRYGGEEFCVMLVNTSIKGALVIAERIRLAAEELRVPIDDNQPPAGRTASIGVAEFSSGDSIEKLLSVADAALYRAKEGGRNRVVS